MRLTFIGKDPESNPTGSPTVYRTDRETWVVQGWDVTDSDANDFYLFDDRMAVFLLYAGNGLATGKISSSDPADIRLCRSAFEAAWKLSIPHSDYQPV